MKYLATGPINNSRSMPLKSGSLQHIQEAYKDTFREVMKCVVGTNYDQNKAYILSGCVNTGTGGAYVISAGYIFYSDQVYRVPASSFTPAVGQTAITQFSTTNVNGTNYDPVQFTDGSSINVHYESIIEIVSGVAGGGVSNFADLIRINEILKESPNLTASYTFGFGFSSAGIFVNKNRDNQVVIECSVSVVGSPLSASTIAIMSSIYRPLHTVRVPLYVSGSIEGYAYIQSNGDIQGIINATNFTNGQNLYFNATYYIQ